MNDTQNWYHSASNKTGYAGPMRLNELKSKWMSKEIGLETHIYHHRHVSAWTILQQLPKILSYFTEYKNEAQPTCSIDEKCDSNVGSNKSDKKICRRKKPKSFDIVAYVDQSQPNTHDQNETTNSSQDISMESSEIPDTPQKISMPRKDLEKYCKYYYLEFDAEYDDADMVDLVSDHFWQHFTEKNRYKSISRMEEELFGSI
eukprot:352424_1